MTLLLAMGALALPAKSAIAAGNGRSSPAAVAAKQKCKKGHARKVVEHKRLCVKKRRTKRRADAPTPTGPPAQCAPAAPAWSDGRWRGYSSADSLDLLFNVVGGRLYTGGFDSFFVDAACDGGRIGPICS